MSVQMFLHSTSTGVAVVVSQRGVKTQFLEEKLELIPDPDTVRIDWLQNNNVQIFRKAVYRKDIDKDYEGDDYIHALENDVDFEFGNIGITNKTVIDDLREAIDAERFRHENPSPGE